MMEEWKEIDGTNGVYEISNTGKVRSNNYLGHGSQKEIALQTDQKGYLRTRIYVGNIRKSIKVHREVAKAFIPNPECKPEVNHKDGNKKNNCVDNLEWVTASENEYHAYANGLKEKAREHCKQMGKKFSREILSKYVEQRKTQVIAIAEDGSVMEFESQREAAQQLGIQQPNIHKCLTGERKTAGGYKWEYATREVMPCQE